MKRAEQLNLPFKWSFTIPKEQLTSLACSFDYTVASGKPITQSKTVNHPPGGFTELINTLGRLKLIDIDRNSVNCDSVLEMFTVNGYKFSPKDNFQSAQVVGGGFRYK